MKILITGGHLMPALAVIDKILSDDKTKQWQITFVGRQFSTDQQASHSLEFQEIKRRPIKFIPFVSGRFNRGIGFKLLKNIRLLVTGFRDAGRIVNLVKPEVILSFGGYIGFPFVFWGWLKKIPVYCHEQTLKPGLANRLSGYLAKKIFVSFSETRQFFPVSKVMVTGNPVRMDVFQINDKLFMIKEKLPVIYVTGGSLGSHSLNVHIENILESLLKDFIVIHQTGNVRVYDDYQQLSQLSKKLSPEFQKRYFLREHFYTSEIGYIFSVADLVVSRAGANTFSELLALKKPAILVPLPWSANNEQQKQAEFFTSHGLGEIFSQYDTSNHLLNLIKKVHNNIHQYLKSFNQLESIYHQDAAETIIETISNHQKQFIL